MNLVKIKWLLEKYKTINNQRGNAMDMYILADDDIDGTMAVTLGVPAGRHDIAEFIYRSVRAGQHTLQLLPPDVVAKFGTEAFHPERGSDKAVRRGVKDAGFKPK